MHRVLTPSNIIAKMHMYASNKLRGVLAPAFDKVLMAMLISRKYWMGSSWTKTNANIEMEATLLVWKQLTDLPNTSWADIEYIIFARRSEPRYFEHAAHGDLHKVPIPQRTDLHLETVDDAAEGLVVDQAEDGVGTENGAEGDVEDGEVPPSGQASAGSRRRPINPDDAGPSRGGNEGIDRAVRPATPWVAGAVYRGITSVLARLTPRGERGMREPTGDHIDMTDGVMPA